MRHSNLESWLASLYDQTKMQQTGTQKGLIFFLQNWGAFPILQNRPSLKVSGYFGAKNTLKMALTFPTSSSYTKYTKFTFWKMTNPVLKSSPKKTLSPMVSPLSTRSSIQRATDRCKDQQDGQSLLIKYSVLQILRCLRSSIDRFFSCLLRFNHIWYKRTRL